MQEDVFPSVCAYLYRGIVSHIISIKCVGSLHTHCVYVFVMTLKKPDNLRRYLAVALIDWAPPCQCSDL